MAGALFIELNEITQNATVTDNRFSRNVAVDSGGAVFTSITGTLTTERNRFRRNVPDNVVNNK